MTRRRRLTVVGDTLLDRDITGTCERLCPDAPVPVIDRPATSSRPGGAGLAALLAAGDGVEVTLVTPLADDRAGGELATLVERAGVRVVALALDGTTPEKVRIRAGEQSVARLDYGERGTVGSITADAVTALDDADAVLVSDYGRGVTAERSVRDALAVRAPATPIVWDPHPRGTHPVEGVRLVTPNRAEATHFTGRAASSLNAATAAAEALVRRWSAAGVAVTLGARGAVLVSADGTPLAVPTAAASGTDPCGAGDRFAARAASALASGAVLSEAVIAAVAAASAFVTAGGASTLHLDDVDLAVERAVHDTRDANEVIARVRRAGGTVVATGGCFDLLHAGHVTMLQAARSLGDCLVVCLNSDASVQRLKGPDRPLVPAEDRAAVLQSLASVDAVVVFDEDTPETILTQLRPDVWAKGADYAVADLPEAGLVQSWGGRAVVLPYLAGRSSSTLIMEASRRAN